MFVMVQSTVETWWNIDGVIFTDESMYNPTRTQQPSLFQEKKATSIFKAKTPSGY